jgi:hypothetical protein
MKKSTKPTKKSILLPKKMSKKAKDPLTRKQATINVVDLMVRYRITLAMLMKELAYAINTKTNPSKFKLFN